MKVSLDSLPLLAGLIVWCFFLATNAEEFPSFGPLVTKESRRTLVSTESGVVTAVDVHDGLKGAYHLQFITLEPSSLFLPVLLHADMVFYVQTGRGTVSWAREDSKDGTTDLDVERGDVYRIEEGTIVYVRSHPDPTREKLRIHAIFNNFNSENPQEAYIGAYSNVSDLVRGFDDRVLQTGFKVSEEDVKAIKSAIKPPPIVHFAPNKTEKPNWSEIFETLIGGRNPISLINGKKKGKGKSKTKTKTFNVFSESPDVKNCNGWSVAVTNRNLKALEASDIGVFMVNLTKGAMMGPHWNPKATEISVVLQGHGMVQVVCPSSPSGKPSLKCQTMRFMVKEGDTFIVPRFHPMAQMSFNNDSLVFMGFSTSVGNNRPQYLAGKWSVLRTVEKDILAVAFGASDTIVKKMFGSQAEGVMLECTSCAEEAERIMQEEIQRKKEEEARKREEEEARKREEEARKREEEEARKREEEAKKREEEEARKREEEAREREEEVARKKREEEEARKREEEKARKREEEEREREEARKKEEKEEKKREEEEREREEEEARKREEEEARKREEEKARKREEEAEEAGKSKGEKASKREEEEARRREEEEEIRRQEEEEIRRQEEEAREREAGGGDRKKEAAAGKSKEEEAGKSKGEEEEASKREEEKIRRQEEEEIRRQEEEAREREAGGDDRKKEAASGKRKEEEARKSMGEEEEASRREEEEEEIQRQEEKEIRRQEEKAREREAGGGDRKKEAAAGKGKEEEEEKREGEEEEARRQEEEEIRRQEEEEYKRQEEEAREREAGGDTKREEADEERRGREGETSGSERVMWRKLWSV